MQTPVSHVAHFLPPTLSAAVADGRNHEEGIALQRSRNAWVVDRLVAVTRQAWFPMLDSEDDDDPEWPRND